MPYNTVLEVVEDLLSFFDETDTSVYQVPAPRIRRLGFYVQRASDELWDEKPWDFKYAVHGPFAFSDGHATLPANVANVGSDGLLWNEADNSREPWAQTDIQTMTALRAIGRERFKRWFAIGLLDQVSAFPQQGTREIWIPKDDANFGQFKLFYEKSPRQFQLDSLGSESVPFPETFHNALFANCVAKLQQAKGDPTPAWKGEYLMLLSRLKANYYVNASRMLQMPNTVGGQW